MYLLLFSRMTKNTFNYLVEELRPHIERRNTRLRRCISVEHRIAITLWRLATNVDYRTLGSLFGVAKCTVCVIFLDTINAITTVLQGRHIVIPTGQRLQVCNYNVQTIITLILIIEPYLCYKEALSFVVYFLWNDFFRITLSHPVPILSGLKNIYSCGTYP